MNGPAWLGIGAQRCGTTWFTDLLTQHPEARLAEDGRKEQHELETALITRWDDERSRVYCDRFAGGLAGEFTPYYLRALWAPEWRCACCHRAAQSSCCCGTRWSGSSRLSGWPSPRVGSRPAAGTGKNSRSWPATPAGPACTPASSKRGGGWWVDAGVVLQYERLVADPQREVARVWRALNVKPVSLKDIDRASRTATERRSWTLDETPGLRDHLRRLYRPEVKRVGRHWGIERGLWPNFA